MKILIYIPDLNQKSGGTTAYIKFLATVLKSKCHIDIVTCHKENEIKPNDNIIHFIRHNLFGFLDIKKIILNIGPDVLHVNTCWLPIASFITSLAYKRNISIINLFQISSQITTPPNPQSCIMLMLSAVTPPSAYTCLSIKPMSARLLNSCSVMSALS